MKTFITLIFAAVCFNLSAQEQYKSCLNNGIAKWSIFVQFEYGSSDEIVAFGDIIINELAYKKLYHYSAFFENVAEITDEIWKNFEPVSYLYESNIIGYIRETPDAAQMYLLRDNEEFLIYDMNMQVGDIFYLPRDSYFSYYPFGEFATVESVYTKNGLKHIEFDRYVFNHSHREKLTFIEGVGTNIGIYAGYYQGQSCMLNCFKNDLIYYKADDSLCTCGCSFFGYGNGLPNMTTKYDYHLIVGKEKINILN